VCYAVCVVCVEPIDMTYSSSVLAMMSHSVYLLSYSDVSSVTRILCSVPCIFV